MARLALSPAVTSRLEVRFLAPVPVERPVRVTAGVTEAGEGRAVAEASVQDDTGLLLAHGRAECVQVRPEYFLSTAHGRARGLGWLPR